MTEGQITQVHVMTSYPSHITVSVDHGPGHTRSACSFVYAPNDRGDRCRVWDELIDVSTGIDSPWLVMGDFKAISSWSEKKGGGFEDGSAMDDFNNFQVQCGLSDAGFSGNKYTWSNNQREGNQIWLRLD
ncbi:hypothetical protein QQ045_010017 [Rhodiola kirilowii]